MSEQGNVNCLKRKKVIFSTNNYANMTELTDNEYQDKQTFITML